MVYTNRFYESSWCFFFVLTTHNIFKLLIKKFQWNPLLLMNYYIIRGVHGELIQKFSIFF